MRDARGSITYAAPLLLVVSLLVGWAALVTLSVLLAWIVVTRGPGAVETPGAALVLVVASVASLPDLVRLLTRRLHRWRITLAPDGLHYVGYRSGAHVPWDRLRGTRVQASRLFRWGDVPVVLRPREDGPRGYGAVIDRSGSQADLLIPQFFFRVPAQQLAEDIERARSDRR